MELHTRLATVRARIAGTRIAEKGAELKALARLDPDRQAAVVEVMLRDENPAASVGAALKALDGSDEDSRTTDDKQFDRLMDLFTRAGPAVRARFLAMLRELGDLQ